MPKVTIEAGDRRIDGEYDFELTFTNRDLHQIKQISGLRVGEFEEALKAADIDFVVALAAIALRRAGKDIPIDALWDLPVGKISLDFSDADEEDDAGPPVPPQQTELASGESASASNGHSSPASSAVGEDLPETSPVSTGSPD